MSLHKIVLSPPQTASYLLNDNCQKHPEIPLFNNNFLKATLLASTVLFTPLTTASADSATADVFAKHAYGAGLDKGIELLERARAADSKNGEAIFGLGALQFFHAIEGLQQDLYRYGAGNQGGTNSMRNFLPVLRVPVLPNPNAEVATYEKVREIFERFVSRLEKADKTLSSMGDTPVKLPFNLLKVRYDSNGDGKVANNESLMMILAALNGGASNFPVEEEKALLVFDTADAHWLRGYTNVLLSIGNFFLSFDFEKSYDASFHTIFGAEATKFGRMFDRVKGGTEEIAAIQQEIKQLEEKLESVFPQSDRDRLNDLRRTRQKIDRDKKLSSTEKEIKKGAHKKEFMKFREAQRKSRELNRKKRQLVNRYRALDPMAAPRSGWMNEFYDPVSFLHSVSWDVTDPARLKQVRQNMLTVMRLNRTTWRLIQAETDNDHEWLPNPKQTSPFPGLKVTQEMIDGWLKTVDAAEAILEGKLLAPHMRFGRGVNMKRFFEEAKTFDLLLFLTGPNSISYVEKGPIWDQSLMQSMSQPFGRNFGAYALWFN